MDALQYLQELQADGAIRHLALTNFDTKHMAQIHDQGIKIVSNQVCPSVCEERVCARIDLEKRMGQRSNETTLFLPFALLSTTTKTPNPLTPHTPPPAPPHPHTTHHTPHPTPPNATTPGAILHPRPAAGGENGGRRQ
jgi:hypothetical protein